ncbi:MAG: DNA cytosine methyltransferase, partial [Pyrinomonadaceae bacterium]|nr:DNA cytosine methyltransferase [Pyrinomonadaceae bacterium]
MTYGFRQAGVDVLAGIDIDPKCRATYKANNKPAKFIGADIKKLSVKLLARRAGIQQNDDNLIFIG